MLGGLGVLGARRKAWLAIPTPTSAEASRPAAAAEPWSDSLVGRWRLHERLALMETEPVATDRARRVLDAGVGDAEVCPPPQTLIQDL